MKNPILFLMIMFFGWNEAIAQCFQDGHPIDCNLSFTHNHDLTVCYGYAMARAFGKDKNWPVTNKVFTEPAEGVDTRYFITDANGMNPMK